MKKQRNQREFTRVFVNMEAEVKSGKSTILGHLTKDISLSGLFLCLFRSNRPSVPKETIRTFRFKSSTDSILKPSLVPIHCIHSVGA
jgi:hypothetical protein